MSHWSDSPEFFDEQFRDMALRGDFGPELQKQVEDGDLCDWEIAGKLDLPTLCKASQIADEAFFERLADAADYRRKAERENFK